MRRTAHPAGPGRAAGVKATLGTILSRRPGWSEPELGYGMIAPTRIYLLPTRQGWIFTALLAVMFVGSVNYSNNLGYFLTFLLGSVGVTSLVHAHRNMVHLKVRAGVAEPVFAGDTARFCVLVRPADTRPRYAVQVESSGHASAPLAVPPGKDTALFVERDNVSRGVLHLGRVAISSCYPLGLVRASAWCELDQACLVYPAPAGNREPPEDHGISQRRAPRGVDTHDDYAGLREYRPGDALRSIAWKATAGGDGIYTKLFASDKERELVLRWQDTTQTNTESRLSQLCLWILICDRAGRDYGLELPATRISPGRGLRHRRLCLEAVARFER